jgi:D-alanine-D-alanine ligase-like ATP-grasp enzyme
MGFSRRSVLPKGQAVTLLPNANLSTGGDAIDVTEVIHPKWKTLARNIARDMNLRYIGIDIMSTETLDKPPGDYVVIEINAAPGLDNYSAMGPRQKRIVEGLYRKALEALIK